MKHHGASMPCPQLTKHGSILGLGTTRSPVLQRSKGDLVVPILCSCVIHRVGFCGLRQRRGYAKKNTDSQNLTDHYWTWLNTKAGADLPPNLKEWQLKQLKQLRSQQPALLGAWPLQIIFLHLLGIQGSWPPPNRSLWKMILYKRWTLLTLKLKKLRVRVAKYYRDCQIASKHRANKGTTRTSALVKSCWIVWKIKSRHRPECPSGQNDCGQKGQQSDHVEYMWRLLLAQSVRAVCFFTRMIARRSTGKQKGNDENIKSIKSCRTNFFQTHPRLRNAILQDLADTPTQNQDNYIQ